jgi:hypothetical protein
MSPSVVPTGLQSYWSSHPSNELLGYYRYVPTGLEYPSHTSNNVACDSRTNPARHFLPGPFVELFELLERRIRLETV